MFLNDYGARWYNPQLNQWHQIDPLAENYYALSSYNYVANNPIKYTDPDGREERGFDDVPLDYGDQLIFLAPGGENPPEVPGCPECDPGSMVLQEVLVTSPWFIGPQRQEEILADLDAMKEVRAEEQTAMPPYVDNISHGDAIVQDNVLLDLVGGVEKFLFKSIGVKLLAAVPFVVKGIGKVARPARYRKGVVEKVWEAAKDAEGKVYDPKTTKEIIWDGSKPRNWDMGHMKEKEFSRLQQSYEKGEISRKEFLDQYNNPANYRPELPSSNRSNNQRPK